MRSARKETPSWTRSTGAARSPRKTKWPILPPAAKTTRTPRSTTRTAVERSGSRRMGTARTPQIRRKGRSPLLRLLKCSRFFTARAAVQITTASFASSEGWTVTPTRSQRREPLISGATASVPGSTITTRRTHVPRRRGHASAFHQR